MAESLARHHYLGHDAALLLGRVVESDDAGVPRDSVDDFLLRRLLRYGLVTPRDDDPSIVVATAAGTTRWRFELVAAEQRRSERERRDVIRRRVQARIDRLDAPFMPATRVSRIPQDPPQRPLELGVSEERRRQPAQREVVRHRVQALMERPARPAPPPSVSALLEDWPEEAALPELEALTEPDELPPAEEAARRRWWQRMAVAVAVVSLGGTVPDWHFVSVEPGVPARPAKQDLASLAAPASVQRSQELEQTAAPMPQSPPNDAPLPVQATPIASAKADSFVPLPTLFERKPEVSAAASASAVVPDAQRTDDAGAAVTKIAEQPSPMTMEAEPPPATTAVTAKDADPTKTETVADSTPVGSEVDAPAVALMPAAIVEAPTAPAPAEQASAPATAAPSTDFVAATPLSTEASEPTARPSRLSTESSPKETPASVVLASVTASPMQMAAPRASSPSTDVPAVPPSAVPTPEPADQAEPAPPAIPSVAAAAIEPAAAQSAAREAATEPATTRPVPDDARSPLILATAKAPESPTPAPSSPLNVATIGPEPQIAAAVEQIVSPTPIAAPQPALEATGASAATGGTPSDAVAVAAPSKMQEPAARSPASAHEASVAPSLPAKAAVPSYPSAPPVREASAGVLPTLRPAPADEHGVVDHQRVERLNLLSLQAAQRGQVFKPAVRAPSGAT